MSQIEINGINLPVEPGVLTWSDLLFNLETRHLGKGKVITSVQFDGSEILQFRDSEVLQRSLGSIEEVKVEAEPMEVMLRSAIKEAEGFLMSLQTSLAEIAEDFRRQLADEANTKLSAAFAGIKMFAALLQGAELQLSGEHHRGSASVSHILGEMGPTLESIIEAQNQHDWILVADILEFELLVHLSSFERSLVSFKDRLSIQ
jgi:hypothetical protein